MNSARPKHQIPELTQMFSRRNIAVLAVLVIGLAALSVYESSAETDTTLLLENSTELNYTDGNQIGTLLVTDNSLIRRFEFPEYEACIYTPENESPIITDVNSVESGLSGNTKNIGLTVDIPVEEIGERDFSEALSVQRGERCPISAGPGVVVTEK